LKKNILKVLFILLLLIVYIYILSIQSIPDNIIIFEGETISLKTILGLKAYLATEDDEIIDTISYNDTNRINSAGKKMVKLNLFENIFLKDVSVDVLPKTTVIPVGNIAGIKLYTSGVLVVGMSEIEGIDNKIYKPYENTGIKEGDTIVSVNNNKIESTEELIEEVNSCNGKNIEIEYLHENQTLQCSITPIQTGNKEYKLGLWVRDSAARSRNSNIL